MLKILQARLQQYVNRELPDVQAAFRKGRGTRDQIANLLTARLPHRYRELSAEAAALGSHLGGPSVSQVQVQGVGIPCQQA